MSKGKRRKAWQSPYPLVFEKKKDPMWEKLIAWLRAGMS